MRALIPILLLAGCVTEAGFVQPISITYCTRLAECEKGKFQEEYSSKHDCVDATRKPWDDHRECAMDVGCSYNAEQARQCLADMQDMTCEEFVAPGARDACDHIYDCSVVDSHAADKCKLDKHHWF